MKSVIREDDVEDPYGFKKADHYVVETHKFALDSQKELLCTGHSFRVRNLKKKDLGFLIRFFFFRHQMKPKIFIVFMEAIILHG